MDSSPQTPPGAGLVVLAGFAGFALLCSALVVAFNSRGTAEPSARNARSLQLPDPDDHRIRVACVGASITKGDLSRKSYPEQLQEMLGKEYLVKNFGYAGATALKLSDTPYWGSRMFSMARDFNPQIVVIQFGSNDARTYNWKPHSEDFAIELLQIVQNFTDMPKRPKVLTMLPPPLYQDDQYSIMASVMNEVIPIRIRTVLESNGLAPEIDVFGAFKQACPALTVNNCFLMTGDGVHPNEKGDWLIAKEVMHAIKGGKARRSSSPWSSPPRTGLNSPTGLRRTLKGGSTSFTEHDVDYVGGEDLRTETNGSSVEECRTLCQGDRNCQAWTYVDKNSAASYKLIHQGSCADFGYAPIIDAGACEQAAKTLGLSNSSARMSEDYERPEGCYFFGAAEDPAFKMWLGMNPLNRGKGTVTDESGILREQVCQLQVFRVSNATCADIGASTIPDASMCELAGRTLGLQVNAAIRTADPGKPDGCYLFEGNMLFLGTNPGNKGKGANISVAGERREPICRSANTTHQGTCFLKARADKIKRQRLAGHVSGVPAGPAVLGLQVQLRSFNGLCLTMPDAELPWDVELRLQACRPGAPSQQWGHNRTTGWLYKTPVRSKGSSPFCIDLASGGAHAVVAQPCEDRCSQGWYHEPGTGRLVARCGERCLGPRAKSGYDAAHLRGWPCDDRASLHWQAIYADMHTTSPFATAM